MPDDPIPKPVYDRDAEFAAAKAEQDAHIAEETARNQAVMDERLAHMKAQVPK